MDYFATSATLKLAIEQGDLDVAFRGFSPAEIAQLRTETTTVTPLYSLMPAAL